MTRRLSFRMFWVTCIMFTMITAGFGQALNGTYTIGGTTPSYATFTAAVNDIVTKGVSGPVVFQVRNGSYNEQINIGTISGVSSTNTVTFQSQTGDSTAVVLSYYPTSTSNFTLKLGGCNYVTFSKISIKATGTTYSTALLLDNNSSNNIITNCVVQASTTTATAVRMAVINSSVGGNTNNTIRNCKIINGSYGIYYYGATTTGITAEYNTLTNQYYRAIEMSYLRSVIVRGNTITTSSAYANFIGIALYNCDQLIKVVRNNVNYANGDYGIYLNTCNGNSGQRGLVANNFVSVQGTSSGLGHGIGLELTNYQNIYFNSVNITRSSSTARCIYQKGTSSSSNLEVRDNILAANGGYMMYFDQTGVLSKSNFNDFYTTGSYVVYWNAANYASLTTWKTGSNMDTNSFSLNPYFVSATDLHVTQSILNNAGQTCAGVTDDFDGQLRNITLPDIGADEWTPPANDAGVTSVYPPCDGLDSVFVTIKNFGGTNLTSAKINWRVNGVLQSQYSWSGNLVPNSTSNSINIGYYNFSAGTQYTVIAYTSLPNAGTDPFNPNDTLKVINTNAGMSGTYTVGGTTPNYATVNDALNALYTYGVCGPVVFNIRNGSYSQQISVSTLNGVSATNTVTFQAETGDSTAVILYSSSSPATVYFTGGNYVIFKKVTIRQNSSYAAAYINTNSSNITFRSCVFEGYNSSTTTASYSCVYIPGTSTNNTFINNRFKYGTFGIYWSGSSSTGFIAQNNRFENTYYRGIGLTSIKAPQIIGNYFTCTTSAQSDFIAIYLSSCSENIKIYKNNIDLATYGTYGIQMMSCTGTSGLHGLIANNFINLYGSNLTTGFGIYLSGCNYQDIFYNSINANRGTSTCYGLQQISAGSEIKMANNIFSAKYGFGIYITDPSSITGSNYNDFYCSNGIMGYWNGNRNTLADWQTASGRDTNSYNVLPAFAGNADLHCQQTLLDNKGRVIGGITDDFDGQTRSISTPDIGADEWTTPAADAGISAIDVNQTFCPGNSNMYVSLKNYGTSTLTSVTINWTVNSVAQTAFSWTGTLAPGATVGPFSIGTYTFLQGTAYTVTASTSLPNGVTDLFTWNDQSQILNKYVSMNGTYTIGGTTPDYATFNLAVTALNQRGVCGPVIFNVRNGTYSEAVTIPAIFGTSSTNTVTFKSETGDSTAAILTYSSGSTLFLNGANYITFKKLTIRTTLSTARAVQIDGGAAYNTFSNNILQGVNGAQTSASYAVVYCSASATNNNNNTFNNNKILYGSYGIYYYGYTTPGTSGIVITNNIITDPYYRGIYAGYLPGVQINNNSITYTTSYSTFTGIYMEYCNDNVQVNNNKVDLTSYGYYALQMYYCYGTAGQHGIVSNNFMMIRGSGIIYGYGIYSYDCRYTDYLNNSVNQLHTDGNNKACYQTSGQNLRFINNIFLSKYGYAFWVDNPAAIVSSDYNDLYSELGYTGYWNGAQTTLANWKTASSHDTNSYSVNPYYVSDGNLHVQQPLLNNVGKPLPQVTTDIDGQTRNATTPDIGADEWNIPPNDAGITSINQLMTLCHGGDSVFVVLKNYGATTLTSVTINWSVNSVAQTPYSWTGSLAPNASIGPFSLGYYQFNIGTQFTITASTSNPNGLVDPFLFNDQSQLTTQYVSMSGTYTIGGVNPDFATFGTAVTALTTYGVCGPVTFDVRNGTYTESINIGNITGVSSINTVTFRSQSGDSTQAILTNSGNVVTMSASNPLFISFYKLNIRSTSGRAFYIYNGSTNINITNCIIESPATSSTSYSGIFMSGIPATTSYIRIKNNVFKICGYGIYFTGNTAPGLEISNNQFMNPYYRGISVSGATAPVIKQNYILTNSNTYSDFNGIEVVSCPNASIQKNTIDNSTSGASTSYYGIYANSCDRVQVKENSIVNSYTSYSTYRGIYLTSCSNDILVSRNKIRTWSGYYGIFIESGTGTSTNHQLIVNNLVSMAGTYPSYGYGIYSSGCTYLDVYYNSINIPNRTSSTTRGLYQTGGSGNYQIKDNIFSQKYGNCLFIETGTFINYCNFNNFYNANGNVGSWNGSTYTTLTAWQLATYKDSLSYYLNPRFVSDTNLNLQEPLLDNVGNPISGITVDYFNNTRNAQHPDMGAIEWTAPPLDAGIQAIDDVASFCITSDSVYVTLKNFGSTNLTSATINWTVNGVAQTPHNWTGNLAQGQTYGPFAVGMYNFSIATLYSIYSWTSNPNGGSDVYAFNDSAKVLNKYLAMSGTYTIGGTNPDFATFSLAATALASSGVCGPVLFNVRNGTYYETFSMNAINGVSSTYTVTFQAESLDSTSVVLTYSGTPLTFSGADYVTYRKLTIRNTGSNPVVGLQSNSNNIGIKNCVIEGYTGGSTSTSYSLIYASAITLSSNFTLANNKMRFGSFGVYCTVSSNVTGWDISNNLMSGQYYRGVYEDNVLNSRISGNTISVSYSSGTGVYVSNCPSIEITSNSINATGSSADGIYVSSCANNIKVSGNKSNAGLHSIYLISCAGTSSLRGLISNNFAMLPNSSWNGDNAGIYLNSSNYQDVFNNSIYATSNDYGIYQTNGSFLRIKNNSVVTVSGYPIYINNPTAISESDYNNIYTTSGYYVGYWNGDRINLAYWQSASGQDAHSISVPPNYLSSTDLHTCNVQFNGAATPLASVTTDIDGQPRDPSTPDIGADEFSGSSLNPGTISGNTTVCAGLTNLIYSIVAIPGATSYTWTVPTGWTITSGQGTNSLHVNTGSNSGSVCVYASNSCGTGSTSCLSVNNSGSISPGAVSGTATVCGNQSGLIYSISSVSGATAYNWTVPSGWSITAGQNSTSLTVTSGSNSGNICVTVTSGCGTSSPSCLAVTVSNTVSTPATIIGSVTVCSTDTALVYSVSSQPDATSYLWTVPAGWTITQGQGTTSVKVNAGTTSGNICVKAVNSCNIQSLASCLAITVNNSISAPGAISGSTTVCQSLAGIAFSIVPVSGATSYTWSVPTGWSITSGQGTNAIIVTSGTLGGNICVTATNSCGVTSGSSCSLISIISSMIAPGTITGLSGVCPSQQGLTYSVATVPGATSYNWTVPTGWTITGGQSTSSIVVTSGTLNGSICVTATNACNITSTASCQTVNITTTFPAPSGITGNSIVCQNQQGITYSAASVPGAMSYNWTVPSGWTITSGQGTDNIVATSGTGGGNVCVTATNACNITSSATCVAVSINSSMQAPGAITGTSSVCPNQAGISYSILPVSGAVSYTWNVPTGWTINSGQGGTSINVTSGSNGGSLCVTATNSCGTTSVSSCLSISINNSVTAPGSISGSSSVCAGLTGLVYSVQPVSGAVSYSWTVPAGWTISGGQGSNSITVTAGSTNGNLCVSAVNACGSSSSSTCLAVAITTTMQAPASISGLTGVCPSQSGLTYSASAVPGATSYTWTVPTGWTITGGQGTDAITVTSGTAGGSICVTATNSCNITSSSTCISVSMSTNFPAPSGISGNITVCQSQPGNNYSAALVPGAASYNWTVPTGWTITSGQGTTDITVTSGTTGGNICVTATNACGITSTSTCIFASINTSMQAPGSISGLASVCQSQNGISYSITPVSGAVSYAWVVPTGWTINSGQGTTAINVTSGTAGGSICVTATNSCGTTSVSSCFSISINSTVAIPGTISGNASVCSGLAGEVYSVQPVNGAVSYTWSTPTGWTITSGQGSNTITVTSGSVGGSICVSAVNVCGSSSSNSCLPVSITTTMQAPGAITGLTGVCPNQPLLTYSVTAVPGASSYTWTVPTGWTIAAGQGTNSITVTSGSTNGAICVTATNACNITSSATCINVNISSTFPAPSSIIGNNFVCQNTQGLYYSVTPVPGAVSYTWSTPSGYIITGGQGTDNIVLTSGTSGGNLCVTATNACGITSVATCLAISINSGMQSPGTITGVSTVCSNQTGLTYSVVPVSGAASYTWTLPNGWIILSGQGTASITATSGVSGGSLCVTATNACGITSVASCQAVSINSTIPTPGTITGIASVCPNLAGLVYSIQPVAGAVSYTWTVPTGWTISSGQGTSTISVASGSGNGNLCVTATNSCGVTSSSSCLPVSIATSMQAPAAITGLAAVCQGQAGISYSVTPVPGAVSYSWNVPSGWVINSGQGTDNINVTAGNSNGSICVNATNSCNLTSQPTCLTVSINTSMQSPGLISGVASVCPSQSGLIYAITPVAGATLYTWTLPTGWIINSGQGTDNINVTAGSGSGSVCVTATNTCNNTSAPSCLSVSSNSSVSAPGTISGNPGVCPGQTGLNYSILPVTGASSYNWTFPTGWIITSGQGTTTVSVIAGSASGSICVTALNSCGLTSTASCTSVTVSNSLAAPGTITGNDSVCGGNSGLTYSIAPVSGASTYNWTLPSGWAITAGAGTTTINVTSGTISGSICVTAGNGCSVSTASCRNVVVKAVVGTPLSISGNSNICGGNTGLAYSISPVANATAYSWTVPNGWTITSGQGSASIMVNAGTNPGTICVVASNACSSSSAACIPVTVGQAPAQPTAVYGPDSICPNTTGQVFYTNNVSGASSYFWSFPAGCVIVSGQGTTMVTVDMGAVGGTISVVASNSCGNSAAATHAIGLYPVPAIPVISVSGNNLISTSAYAYQWQLNGSEIPGAVLQAIAPSGSGFYNVTVYNSFGCSATSAPFSYNASGVDEVTTDASGMNVYPNPVHTMLTLTADFAQEQTFSVRLMNVLGELVNVIDDNYTGTAYSRTVNMEQLPSGVYYIILSTKDKNIYTKVVKN
ncbi:MAG: right-handed parallel beta-helix repeat-containing protein [Bacteroidota bacterium]